MDLVSFYEVTSKILWLKYFIESQEDTVEQDILIQDDNSTIILVTNNMFSSSSKMKHTRHKFFLVKDNIHQGDLEVEYEPTNRMWSDILTKPK